MTNEQLPKFILKKINQKRAEQGLCTYEEEEKKRKEKDGKPMCDVRRWFFSYWFLITATILLSYLLQDVIPLTFAV